MKRLLIIAVGLLLLTGCNKKDNGAGQESEKIFYDASVFVMGADLSYVNEILDHGGYYIDSGKTEDPYRIFSQYGTNVARFRLFHNPVWTSDQYGGGQMYQDFNDVREGIARSKAEGMQTCLDFHYSDTWADPGKQIIPAAWEGLSLELLHDSIYNYTFNVLTQLDNEGLMPEYVQVGNEINPGFVLPQGNRWNNNRDNFVYLLNSAIKAVRDVASASTVDTRVMIHIAQPENIGGWFSGLQEAGLADYDIIGFSYYYIWSVVPLANVSDYVNDIRETYNKDVMILETAYPWTLENADSYGNIISASKVLTPNYPVTQAGQLKYLIRLTQEVIDGGGKGIIYWEPAWITCDMKTQWGDGSAWDCNTFFDFTGTLHQGIGFMTYKYQFK